MKEFINLYPQSKTLRFELIPQGNTLNNIQHLITEDEVRALHYQEVKKYIDDYHKFFINDVLSNLSKKDLNQEFFKLLDDFNALYISNPQDSTKIENVQSKLRKLIVAYFKNDNRFSRINKKELIKEDLQQFIESDSEKSLIQEFESFTTYFTGFHENRMNMYSDDAKSTSIAFRLINQNLPKFIDNLKILNACISVIPEDVAKVGSSFDVELNKMPILDFMSLENYPNIITQKSIDLYNSIIGGKVSNDSDQKIQGINEYINLYNQKQNIKSNRLPKLKPLFKQILSDRNSLSWLPEAFSSDQELISSVNEFYSIFNATISAPLKNILKIYRLII